MPDMKVALVTGGARRLGAAIVRALAADNWRVLIHYRQSGDAVEALVAELRTAGGTADAIDCDLGDAAATETLIPRCLERTGRIDCLINNAALFEPDWLHDLTSDGLDQHLAVNLKAPILLTQAFAKAVPDDTDGVVINLLDNKIFSPNPDYFSYSITKFGLKGRTEMAAMALAPNIRVCGIAPGLTLASGDQTEAEFRRAGTKNLLARPNGPEEIVAAVRISCNRVSSTDRSSWSMAAKP